MKNFFKKIGSGIETALNGANKTIETLGDAAGKYNEFAKGFERASSLKLIKTCKDSRQRYEAIALSYEDMLVDESNEEKKKEYKSKINEMNHKIVELDKQIKSLKLKRGLGNKPKYLK